jgi:hypothetical protein
MKNQSEPNKKAIAFQGENGQTPNPSDQEPQGNQAQEPGQERNDDQPEFVTREEAERMVDEAVSRAQSLVDKSRHSLQQEIQSAVSAVERSIELAESSGVELSEEQKKAMRDRAKDDVLIGANAQEKQDAGPGASGSGDPQEPSGPDEPESSKQKMDATSAAGLEIMQDVGVTLHQTDPEAQEIDHSSRGRYLASLEQACLKKKARLASQGSRTPTNAGMEGRKHDEPIGAEKNLDAIWEQTGL